MAKFPNVKTKVAEKVAVENVAEEVITDAVQEEKEEVIQPIVVVEDAPQEKPKATTEKIIPNKTFRTYIGNRWYDFVEGEEVSVDIGVAFELREVGNID